MKWLRETYLACQTESRFKNRMTLPNGLATCRVIEGRLYGFLSENCGSTQHVL
jgi:hypothetical protein